MILEEIIKQTQTLVTLSQRLDSADLMLGDLSVTIVLLKHRSVSISQKVGARLWGPPRLAMNRKMDVSTDDHETSSSNANFKWSSASYQTAESGPHPFPSTLTFNHTASYWREWHSTHRSHYFKDSGPISRPKRATLAVAWSLRSHCLGSWDYLYPLYLELCIISSSICLNVERSHRYKKLGILMALIIELWDFALHFKRSWEKRWLRYWPSLSISRIRSTILRYVRVKLFKS